MKFKMKKDVKGAVNRFTDSEGIVHYPGDIVDLPISYKGSPWLETLEPEPKVKVPAAKIEKVEETVSSEPPEIPLSSTQQKRRKTIPKS